MGIWLHSSLYRCPYFGLFLEKVVSGMCNLYGMAAGFQAMSFILRTADEIDVWMNAPAEEALQLQRPLPDNELVVLKQ
ncbi:hypothetical protein J1W56_20815 [Phyllobacterium sp. R2-JL]|nr:hypothetical protein [Phyllobacterium calauticae]